MASFYNGFKKLFSTPWINFFLIEFVALMLWWLAFYPGVMSPDSIDQWYQSGTMDLNNWHPYIHTLLIAALRLLWDTPAVVSLFQVLATAFLLASIFNYFWRNGLNRCVLAIFFFLSVTSLPIGIYSVTLWKDVGFSLAVIGLGFFLMVRYREANVWSRKHIVYLLLLSLASIFFRHNGVIYIVFLPLILFLFFYKKIFVRYFLLLLLPIFIFLQFAMPFILHVKPTPAWVKNIYIYHSTAAFYAGMPYTFLTPESKTMMEMVLPAKELVAKYNPAYWDPLYWNPSLNKEVFYSSSFWQTIVGDFYSQNVWLNLPTFIGERTNLFIATTFGYGMINGVDIVPNDYALETVPLSVPLNTFFTTMLAKVHSHPIVRVVIWCSWLGVLLGILLFIDSIYRKKYAFQLFSSIMLIQVPFLFLVNPASDWRYVYFMYLAVLIMIPAYLLPPVVNTNRNS